MFQWVSDAQISPDGSRVAFVLTRVHPNEEKDTYESHIWIVSTRRGVPYRFTSGKGRDVYPRWSPTGKYLLFLSTREEEKETSGKEVSRGGAAVDGHSWWREPALLGARWKENPFPRLTSQGAERPKEKKRCESDSPDFLPLECRRIFP